MLLDMNISLNRGMEFAYERLMKPLQCVYIKTQCEAHDGTIRCMSAHEAVHCSPHAVRQAVRVSSSERVSHAG